MGWWQEKATDEQKAAIEQRVREKAVRDGIDPDARWAWFLRIQEDKPVTLRDMLRYMVEEAKRQGWYEGCDLDYEAGWVHEDCVVDADIVHRFVPNFGASEGIYLDWEYQAYNPKTRQRETHSVTCWKTLATTARAMEAMGRLGGRLTYLANTIM